MRGLQLAVDPLGVRHPVGDAQVGHDHEKRGEGSEYEAIQVIPLSVPLAVLKCGQKYEINKIK